MTRRIIGITVGTPMNPQTIVDSSEQAKQLEENTKSIDELTESVGELTEQVNNIPPNPTKVSELENDKNYATQEDLKNIEVVTSWNDLQDKPSIPTKTSDLSNDSGYLTSFTETDPTVPTWAKQSSKPTYTASEVGADPSGTAETKVSTHNTSTESHSDIRLLITELTTKVNHFLDVDDTTVDELSEVLDLINKNKGTLESLTTDKVNVSDIIDNLTTSVANKPLSAKQGVALKGLIDALTTSLNGHTSDTTKHITSEERTSWNNKSNFSGSYNDLTNKPTIPSKTSQLTNDSNFVTKVVTDSLS